jgi:4-amino-4-deoxy-L-arabinose transferase-like glycosyltransferase
LKRLEIQFDRWTFIHLGILVIALLLEVALLMKNGYNNTYYAAGVRSMAQNWHNFFFASYDPGGFISIDKTPLALWIQVLSVKLFGFHGWALILPQTIAHLLSVELLYRIVKNSSDQKTGLLSAAILALTPISVVMASTNQPDSILILFLILCGWMLFKSIESGKFRYLVLSTILLGLSFNTKGAQSFIVIPALLLTYVVAFKATWNRKVVFLFTIGIVLALISFAWIFTVDSIPPDKRPFVGSTNDNSELSLALGYNGMSRLLGQQFSSTREIIIRNEKPQRTVFNGIGAPAFGGQAGTFRLFNKSMGGQASWFLVVAIFGAIGILLTIKKKYPLLPEQYSGIFWSCWLLCGMVVISLIPFMHPYYVATLAPAIAVLSGSGFMLMIKLYKSDGWGKFLLPLSIFFSALSLWLILNNFSEYYLLKIISTSLLIFISVILSFMILAHKTFKKTAWNILIASTLFLIFLPPALWIKYSFSNRIDAILPQAGPNEFLRPIDEPLPKKILTVLKSRQNNSKFIVATQSSFTADDIIIKTGLPVMNLGGFYGTDPVLSFDEFKNKLETGVVRYFLMGNIWKDSDYNFDKAEFVTKKCELIESAQNNNLDLYDCKNISL